MMKDTSEKTYRPHALVPGKVIGKEGIYVAIPDKGYKDCKKIFVIFNGRALVITNWHKAEAFRRFHDKFNGPDYTLGYFKWSDN